MFTTPFLARAAGGSVHHANLATTVMSNYQVANELVVPHTGHRPYSQHKRRRSIRLRGVRLTSSNRNRLYPGLGSFKI
jgi:hypothetical protein